MRGSGEVGRGCRCGGRWKRTVGLGRDVSNDDNSGWWRGRKVAAAGGLGHAATELPRDPSPPRQVGAHAGRRQMRSSVEMVVLAGG